MSRCRPEKWFKWGAIPLALIALLVIIGLRSSIESELADRSASALEAAGLPWAAVKFKGRDGTLVGNALSDNDRQLGLATVSSVWGVRRISDRASLVERVDPYTWWAIRSEGKLRIKGHVMSSDVRRVVQGVAEASFPGETIDDRMVLAAGSLRREEWLAAVSFALVQLTNLKEGTVRLMGLALAVKGEASGFDEYDAIRSAMEKDLPSGVRVVESAVLPPTVKPFAWSATIQDKSVTLDGHVPAKDVREALLSAAGALVSDAVLVDRARIAGGAPENWLAAVRVGLNGLGRMRNGQLSLSDKLMRLTGEVGNEDDATSIRNAILRDLPKGYRLSDKIVVKEADASTPAIGIKPTETTEATDGAEPVAKRVRFDVGGNGSDPSVQPNRDEKGKAAEGRTEFTVESE